MITENAQQAGNLKYQSSYAKGGSLQRVLTMFTTSPVQYMNNTNTAIVDAMAGRKGSKKKLAKMLFINQIILPSAFYWMSVLTSNAFKDDEDDETFEEALPGWLASMVMGPFSGAFVFGKGLSEMATGWAYSVPILSAGTSAKKAIGKAGDIVADAVSDEEEVKPQDVIAMLDFVADTAAYTRGKGLGKAYEVTKNVSKSFGFTKEDVAYIALPERERSLHDLGKIWSKGRKDFAKDKSNPDDDSYLDARYEYIGGKYQEWKDAHPSQWEEVEELLDEKGKLPGGVESEMD
jgi:hypothetical protein